MTDRFVPPAAAPAVDRAACTGECQPTTGAFNHAPGCRSALRELIAAALYRHEWPHKQIWQQALAMDRETFLTQAEAVLAVLPDTGRPAVLREAAERVTAHAADHFPDEYDQYADALADELRRLADETPDTERRCTCPHPSDEHSVYGCADDCACEWMPKKKPSMDPVHILGIKADDELDAKARCTCADAGASFAPSDHYADCPAAERQDGAQP